MADRAVQPQVLGGHGPSAREGEPGEIDPDDVDTPGVYVQRVVVLPRVKRIERRTVRKA